MYGGLNHNRIQMTKERLLDISFGRKPDLKQLDGWGRKKPMRSRPTRAAGARQERDEADEEAVGERRPGWLSVSQDAALPEDETDRAEAATAAAAKALASRHSSVKVLSEPTTASSSSVAVKVDDEDDRDDAQQEDARKEWLEYYLKVGEWEKAEALVVSAEEREDLNYLRGRAEREARYAPVNVGVQKCMSTCILDVSQAMRIGRCGVYARRGVRTGSPKTERVTN